MILTVQFNYIVYNTEIMIAIYPYNNLMISTIVTTAH